MIADYSELIAEVTERSGISDVANRAGMFVSMAENMLSKRLRMANMETVIRLKTDANGLAELPDDYSEMCVVRVENQEIKRKTNSAILEGCEKGYSIQGKYIKSSRRSIEHVCSYFAAIPALEKYGVNWLLEGESELYLHAVLFQVYTAGDQIEKAQMTSSYIGHLIDEANHADIMKRIAGTRINLGSS